MAAPGNMLFSLQSKLIGAFVLVALTALVLAGSVFVFVRRGEQEQQELNKVTATSPLIYAAFSVLQERGAGMSLLGEFVEVAANETDVRILLVDRRQGTVEADSEDSLTGEHLTLPDELFVTRPSRLRPYVSWEPSDGSPGSDLILVSAVSGDRLRDFRRPGSDEFALILAVPKGTIAGAWQGLLPALLVAAAIALPVAIVLAVFVARYITRPLQQLTVASQRMAEGTFDVQVSVDRQDELGQLAQAFSTMAQRVGEAHTQMRMLVANVSHDLKTPLTSILGFAQALRDGGAEEQAEVRRMGGVIHEEASRLTARLNDLLYLSELESGQALLERDEIDVGRLLEGAIERIEPEVRRRDVRLNVDLAGSLTLSADGAKLERALENLLDNARKYTPDGGEIRVRTWQEAGSAYIEVANTAPDVSPEELPRLFERFYRRDRARAEAGRSNGSGLGLAIARDLIELHGGALDATVREGELVFTVRLPLAG